MRLIQLTLLIIAIQVAGSIITHSGLFNIYYEKELVVNETIESPLSSSEAEQWQTAVAGYNMIVDALTWNWVKAYIPFYNVSPQVKTVTDYFIWGLRSLSYVIIVAGIIQFLRNLVKPL